MIEVELRYKVLDVSKLLEILAAHNIKPTEKQHIIDRWFAPLFVRSQADQDQWYDHDHGIAYRIRCIGDHAILDSKQHTTANNHNTFKEEVLMQGDQAAMRAFLAKEHYYNWLTIDKTRLRFDSPRAELDVVVDTVAGVKDALGVDTVLEIEYQGNGTRDQALQAIADFAAMLNLGPEQLFKKSLTVESMRVLAKFK